MNEAELTEKLSALKVELARMTAKLEALDKRIDDAVVSQVRDHGKRIAALEKHQAWIAGAIALAGGVGASVGTIIQVFMR